MARRNNMINPLNVKIDSTNIDRVDELNFLGINFNEQLNWQSNKDKISNRCSRTIFIYITIYAIHPHVLGLCYAGFESNDLCGSG